MSDVTIDRLSLHLSGLSEAEGQRLARLVADGLARASMPDGLENRDAVQTTTIAHAGGSMQAISQRIVADILRQLQRTV